MVLGESEGFVELLIGPAAFDSDNEDPTPVTVPAFSMTEPLPVVVSAANAAPVIAKVLARTIIVRFIECSLNAMVAAQGT